MKTEMVSRAGYKDIFNSSTNIEKHLSNLDLETSLEFLVLLNKYEYKLYDKNKSDLNFICNEWLSESNHELKEKIIDCYKKILHENNSKRKNSIDLRSIKIINKNATLRTIEILLSKSNHTPNNHNSSIENLFLLYLAVNDEIAEREMEVFKMWMPNFEKKENEIRFHLFLGLSQVVANPEAPNKKVWVEILKFVQFEKWIKNQDKYKDFVESYLEQFGVTNWYELITIIFYINNMAIHEIKISKNVDEKYLKLLSYFANHNESKIDWNELTEIRKNPFYKLNNGDFLIIDSGYLMDKFFSGIYHDILNFSSNNTIVNFHQNYSKEFIEEFLLVNALKAVFGNNYIQFSEAKIKDVGKKGIDNLALPDFYIRNGNKVFLFECKNSFISNKFKIETNCKAIEKDIIDKFYYSNNKKKAIKQLANFIELSQNGEYNFFDDNSKLNNINYYPILIVTDSTLTSLGFNQLFNEFFFREIHEQNKERINRVKPITIIHINDLLYRTKNLKKLDKIIEEYQAYCLRKNALENMISFTNYLDMYKFKKNHEIDLKSIKHIMDESIIPDN